jgi:hypothetical protein
MSRIDSKPYNEAQVQNIRRMLDLAIRNGQPIYYEFKVDGMVFIPHTNRVEAFDEYKDFIYHGAEEIEFSIFSSNSNDKNRKSYIYHLKEQKQELNGFDVKMQVNEEMEKFKTKLEIEQLKKEIQLKDNEILQQDEWIADVQNRLKEFQSKYEELKANPNHFGQLDLVKLLSGLANEFVKHNPKVVEKIPMLNGFSNAMSPNNSSSEKPFTEREVSYEIKEEGEANKTSSEISEDDAYHIQFGNQLTEAFDDDEIDIYYAISNALMNEPQNLKPVAELLNVKK